MNRADQLQSAARQLITHRPVTSRRPYDCYRTDDLPPTELAAPSPGCRTRFVALWSELDA
ncbi:MAG: hypothetical protein ABR615_07395 [Pseudonocardiaceae bacterium]